MQGSSQAVVSHQSPANLLDIAYLILYLIYKIDILYIYLFPGS